MPPKNPTLTPVKYVSKVFIFLMATTNDKIKRIYPIPYVCDWKGKLKEIKNTYEVRGFFRK